MMSEKETGLMLLPTTFQQLTHPHTHSLHILILLFQIVCVMMCVQAQRKRRTTGSPLVLRPSTKTSRGANARRTANATRAANGNRAANSNRAASIVANRTANISRTSDGDPASLAETIDVMDNTEDSQY